MEKTSEVITFVIYLFIRKMEPTCSTSLSSKILSFYAKLLEMKNLYYALYGLLFLFIFVIMFVLNINTPMIGDDYVYSFVFTTSQKITNISDIFTSQYIHYNVWGGRVIAHSVLQYLIYLKNPTLVSCINSFIFILFINVIQWHAIGKIKFKLSLTFVIFSLLFLLQPAFGETCLWLTGSLNYLWGTTIILLFLVPYRLYSNQQSTSKVRLTIVSLAMFVFGIIAGWVSENLSLGMIFMCISFIVFYKMNKKGIPAWMIIGIIGAIIGYLMMIKAPGNYARAAEAGPTTPFIIIYRFLNYTKSFVYYLGLINLLTIIALIIYKRETFYKFLKIRPILLIYFLGIFVSVYTMIVSPSFPPRAWFGIITLNIIILTSTFYNINKDMFLKLFSIKICIITFCLIKLTFNIYDAYSDISDIKKIWNNRITTIVEANKNNNRQIVFDKYYAKTKFGMSDAPYANEYVSKYYNIDFSLK